jgi:dynamin 1-like protein
MAHRYVSDSRTIILAVCPANADLTTADGLQMAREVDPKGIRTIGVITKIDIMDKGTNAKRMIEGKDVALRLGYIGIKNRSQ